MPADAVELLEPRQITEIVARWESADRHFANTLHSGIPHAKALAKLGVRLCVEERYTEAVAVLRAAIALSPRDPLLWNNLAVVYERANLSPDAVKSLEHSLDLSRAQPDAWLLLANLRKKCGDLGGAAAAYEETLAIEPASPIAWQGLGLVKQEQREYRRAIECFRTCAKSGGATAPVISILGQLFYQTGQFEKSRDAYVAAIELDPGNPIYEQMRRKMQFICDALAGLSVDDAIQNFCRVIPAPTIADIDELLKTTFSLLSGYGHADAAQRVGEKRLSINPSSATTAYLLNAVKGNSALTRSPDDYLIEYFDSFAEGFDHQLVHQLGYEIPQKLCGLASACISPDQKLDVLDIGCGTGLCGPLLKPVSRVLTGVDLSPKMLQVAARRTVYDRLVQQEVTAYLTASPATADLIVATDVLIYFGDLRPLFEAVAIALRPGARFAFSIERSANSDHQLLPSGRFAHGVDYVRWIAGDQFLELATESTTVRLEAAMPVQGDLFIFQRR